MDDFMEDYSYEAAQEVIKHIDYLKDFVDDEMYGDGYPLLCRLEELKQKIIEHYAA